MRKWQGLVVLLVASWAIQSQATLFKDSIYVPDIETFMQIGGNADPQVSSDGSVRCFSSGMSGVNQVYRVRKDGWPEQLTYFTDGADFYKLSHDGKWMVVGAATGGSEETNLHLVEVATGRSEALTDLKGTQVANPIWSRDDQKIYYRSNEANKKDFHVFEMDMASRKTRPVVADSGYNSPSLVSDDGKWLVAAKYPSNTNSDLYLVDLSTGNASLLTAHEGNALFDAVAFLPDMSGLYIICNKNPEGIARRAKLSLKSHEITWIDQGTKWEVEEFILSPDGQMMAWVMNEDGLGALHIADAKSGVEYPEPTFNGLVSNVSFEGPDGVVFAFTSAADPPDCWRWDYASKQSTQWTFSVTAGIDKALFVRPELVRFPSFDGLQISGFLYMPPGKKKGDHVPFIVSAHGGPESQFRPAFVRNFQYFALNGFGILALNPRGSSGYGQAFLDMDNYKNRMKSVKDYETATKWLAAQGYADARRIAITGGSYGGYMTMACITDAPDLYAAACEQVGIANFVTFLQNTAPYRRALRESEYGPLSDSAFLKQISPIHQVDRVKAPLQIVAGENDPRVPVEEARQMAKAISARGGVVDTLIFSDEGHGVSKRSNVLVTYRRLVDFFKKYLMAPAPAN
jgi:dipeptidyl aminopeptidase/acylaminoacyl peptidase